MPQNILIIVEEISNIWIRESEILNLSILIYKKNAINLSTKKILKKSFFSVSSQENSSYKFINL